ncbi:hypothetical protein D478_24293 [Brevibacillus agri BAB-2500]|nr:hypothetical protein D478_24293 [Brevibacillus agri BAB-2500]
MRIRLGVEANFEPTPKATEKVVLAEMREAQLVLDNALAATRIANLEQQNAAMLLEIARLKGGLV